MGRPHAAGACRVGGSGGHVSKGVCGLWHAGSLALRRLRAVRASILPRRVFKVRVSGIGSRVLSPIGSRCCEHTRRLSLHGVGRGIDQAVQVRSRIVASGRSRCQDAPGRARVRAHRPHRSGSAPSEKGERARIQSVRPVGDAHRRGAGCSRCPGSRSHARDGASGPPRWWRASSERRRRLWPRSQLADRAWGACHAHRRRADHRGDDRCLRERPPHLRRHEAGLRHHVRPGALRCGIVAVEILAQCPLAFATRAAASRRAHPSTSAIVSRSVIATGS